MPSASELDTNSDLLPLALAADRRAFVCEVSSSKDVPYALVEGRLDRLPEGAMPLLLGAAGWFVLAGAIGLPYAPTVH